MLKPRCGFYFSVIGIVLFLQCQAPLDSADQSFKFAVVNVGQGLSQIGVCNGNAIVWDVGPENGFSEWLDVYKKSGNPFIESIVLSHSDLDHAGALSLLDGRVRWSGTIITNAFEDTIKIRNMLTQWKNDIKFRIMRQNDTLLLDNVNIQCVWPPMNIAVDKQNIALNQVCLAFRIQHYMNTIFISSDLDSSNLTDISNTFNGALRSDILVVPHHGSKSSCNYTFLGYTASHVAVISYGENNTYGHPSQEMISLLFSLQCEIIFTAVSGTCYFKSNGFYWTH